MTNRIRTKTVALIGIACVLGMLGGLVWISLRPESPPTSEDAALSVADDYIDAYFSQDFEAAYELETEERKVRRDRLDGST